VRYWLSVAVEAGGSYFVEVLCLNFGSRTISVVSGVALLEGVEHQHGLSIQYTVLSSLAR
jgi:hypothetical protein